MIRFLHPEYFYAVTGIPVMIILFFLLLKWKKNATRKIGDISLVKQLIQGFSSSLFTLKFLLVLSGFALCAVAAATLVKPTGVRQSNRTGIDVMIALDVSNSMLADDIKPNRLERAKQIVSRLIDKLSDDRIGIVVFAGRAYLQMPMTTDHSAAKMYLASSSPDDVPTQGTVISEALKKCFAAFNTKEKKYRAIIMITDGEDHDKDAIRVTRQLVENGIMVNTVGIGSPQGAPIIDKATNDYKKDENGNTVITKLNEQELRTIAQNGNGIYQLFTTTEQVAGNLQRKLSGMGQTTITETSFVTYENYFWYFLLAAFAILVIEFFISEKRIRFKSALNKNAIVIILLLLSDSVFSQQTNSEIIEGNNAYKKNNFNEAASSYQKALSKDPENTIASYNLGNSIYKNEKADDAIKFYDNAIKNAADDQTRSKGYYNKGVAFQKQNKLPECIEAYKNALRLTPNDEEARQNLERALMQQKQQEKKPDEQKDKKNKKQDQNKNQNQQQKKQPEPKPQPSKISKQDAEEKLKSLVEHEKDLQDKLKKARVAAPDQPKKDW